MKQYKSNLRLEIYHLIRLMLIINSIFIANFVIYPEFKYKYLLFTSINLVLILYNISIKRVINISLTTNEIYFTYLKYFVSESTLKYNLSDITYRIKEEGIAKNSVRRVLRIYVHNENNKVIKLVSGHDGWNDELLNRIVSDLQLGFAKVVK